MSLWAEHTVTLEQYFERSGSLESVRQMKVFGEHNWLQYAADELTEMRGHLLKYPVEVDRTGKVKSLHAAASLYCRKATDCGVRATGSGGTIFQFILSAVIQAYRLRDVAPNLL
ncbi:Phospholipase D gamma 1 [Capsicum chinense]|nr:Phospholipase D gamma 1 [Capsicum chinense]